MKRIITPMLVFVMSMAFCSTAFAYNYDFSTGEDTLPGFGKSTSNSDPVTPDPMNQNVRRNKDASDLPPPYFYGSGDIPTDTSSPYHDNSPVGAVITNGSFVGDANSVGSMGYSSSIGSSGIENGGGTFAPGIEASTVGMNFSNEMLASTSLLSGASNKTEAKYYDDGTIGTLHIEKIDKTLTVHEGESKENLINGIGHFESTSVWDGNCGFAGHNRGSDPHFSFVKNLENGDKITYTTLYGTRTYEVYNKEKIMESDCSGLGWTAENIITMITCVEDEPAYRWQVQAKEIR